MILNGFHFSLGPRRHVRSTYIPEALERLLMSMALCPSRCISSGTKTAPPIPALLLPDWHPGHLLAS